MPFPESGLLTPNHDPLRASREGVARKLCQPRLRIKIAPRRFGNLNHAYRENPAMAVSQGRTKDEFDGEGFVQRLQAVGAASQALNGWIAGAQNFALLQAAMAAGVIDALRKPCTIPSLGASCGIDENRAESICLALAARGVCEREGDAYRLSSDFELLASGGGMQLLADTVGGAEVVVRTLQKVASPDLAYTELPSEDMLAMAYLASARAELPLSQAFFAFVSARMPEVQAIWSAGGRHLELGCGIGGTLLGPLLLFPQLKGVGVEIDPTIVDHIRRRVAQLGLTERAEIRLGDARKIDEDASYDTVLWSQTFFPRETRQDTLSAIHRALKAGGYLLMPILYGDPPQSLEALREPGGRTFTLNRLVYGHWGVPLMGSQDLQAEATEAGFATVSEVQTPVARYLLVQKVPA